MHSIINSKCMHFVKFDCFPLNYETIPWNLKTTHAQDDSQVVLSLP